MALAVYNGELLVIRRMENYGGTLQSWLKQIGTDLQKYRDEGFDVIIESQNKQYEDCGRVVTLDQIDEEERRTYQNIGLDHYYDMIQQGDVDGNRRGAISLPKAQQNRFLSENQVYVEQDEKGRNRYRVDADQGGLNGYHKAIILSVLVAVHFNEVNDAYVERLVGMIDMQIPDSPVDRMMNIFDGKGGILPGDKEAFPRKLGL